ncbi:putative component of translocase of the outer mitochondrial membrane complex protein [Rutstroemia sp. NJR-2017a WRK4]|nr:putative component of translocase of the outer mitochondrial membrane complex protein [Rutstroemia sp. NJR-2017a WRK4]PQE25623.1 putative component of translocase of the outer mitochondrial membrane complex protein [Rutstroemia sp. NJR-2017a BBW]
MAPKSQRVYVERERGNGPRRGQASKGYAAQAYAALTSPENASVVRSVGVFGVAVAFFASGWSDVLLPP